MRGVAIVSVRNARVRRAFSMIVLKISSYGAVSLLCFVLNNLLLILADKNGLPLWASLLLSGATIIPLGYLLQSTLTFQIAFGWPAFARYSLIMLPNLPFAFAILWVLRDLVRLPMHYAAPAATVLMLIWNAAGSAWALRRRSRKV